MSSLPNEELNALQAANAQLGAMREEMANNSQLQNQQMMLLAKMRMVELEAQLNQFEILKAEQSKQEQLRLKKNILFAVKENVANIERTAMTSLTGYWMLHQQNNVLEQHGMTQESFDDFHDKEYFVEQKGKIANLIAVAEKRHGQDVISDFWKYVRALYEQKLLLDVKRYSDVIRQIPRGPSDWFSWTIPAGIWGFCILAILLFALLLLSLVTDSKVQWFDFIYMIPLIIFSAVVASAAISGTVCFLIWLISLPIEWIRQRIYFKQHSREYARALQVARDNGISTDGMNETNVMQQMSEMGGRITKRAEEATQVEISNYETLMKLIEQRQGQWCSICEKRNWPDSMTEYFWEKLC